VTTLTLVPLALSLTMALGVCLQILKRKSLAQAMCVQEAMQLQENLKKPLEKLMRLNKNARLLRQQRLAADRALQAAIASGVPYAIAAAKAVQLAVIAMQISLRSQQEALLLQADRTRRIAQQSFYQQAWRLGGRKIETPTYFFRALAVRPEPATSLTPDYVKVPFFEQAQQQRLRFELPLIRGWLARLQGRDFSQRTECSVTLKGENLRWEVAILAAKAPSSY